MSEVERLLNNITTGGGSQQAGVGASQDVEDIDDDTMGANDDAKADQAMNEFLDEAAKKARDENFKDPLPTADAENDKNKTTGAKEKDETGGDAAGGDAPAGGAAEPPKISRKNSLQQRAAEQGFQLVAVADAKKHTATFLDDAEAAFAAGGESDAAEDSDDSEEDYVKALSTKNLTTLKKKLEDAEEELDVVLEDIAADKGGKFILVAMKKEIDALEDDDPEKERLTNKLHHITSTFITFKNMFKGTNYDPNVFREVAMVFQAEHANVVELPNKRIELEGEISNLEDAIEAKEKEHEEARKKKKEARREVKRKQRKDQRKRSGDFALSSPFDTRSEKKAKLLK